MINLDDIQPNVVTDNMADKIWLFYGEMATRKTSVACSFPKHLLIATEVGYKFINGAMPALIQSWSEFKSILKQLDRQSNKDRFDIIVIDTIGQLYQMCYQYMLTQMGVNDPGEVGYGMGWKKIRLEFETSIRAIVQKGYGLIMLAHSDEVEKEDKNTKTKNIVTKIDIDKRPDLIIKGLADFVLFLHKEVKEGTTDTPTVYAYSDLVTIDTKSRSRYFRPKFEFTYENLQQELHDAVARQYAVEGGSMPDGIESTNPYTREEVSFATLKKDVVELAQSLVSIKPDDVGKLLTDVFKGTKVSDLKESAENLSKLQVVYTTLLDLKAMV